MSGPIFIIETPRGGLALSFESLTRAKEYMAKHKLAGRIIEQTIRERVIG